MTKDQLTQRITALEAVKQQQADAANAQINVTAGQIFELRFQLSEIEKEEAELAALYAQQGQGASVSDSGEV